MMRRVAINPGHHWQSPGTVSPIDGTREHTFVAKLAAQLYAELLAKGYEVGVFEQPVPNYRQGMDFVVGAINAFQPHCVVSLHSNAMPDTDGTQTTEISGTMCLHASNAGASLGNAIASSVGGALGIRSKGSRLQATSWAGAPLHILTDTKAPAVIVETHFMDNETDHKAALAALDSGALARSIAYGVSAWLGGA